MEITLDPRDKAPKLFLKEGVSLGLEEQNLRRYFGSVVGRGEFDPGIWSRRGIFTKDLISTIAPLPRLTIEKEETSKVDGFKKLLFRCSDGLAFETVIIPLLKEKKVTICLSSQVGCVMGCVFCATTRMKDRRNLLTWEIVDQFIQARAVAMSCGQDVSGAVFMGMGEPFLNYERVMAAAEILCYPVVNAISGDSITVSTVGLVSEIERFTDENRPFRLSISLGSAIDEKRAKLVPIAAKTPVKRVMEAARRYAKMKKTRVMLAYVCISGENMFEEDAKALAALIQDTPVRLDLIEVRDSTGRFTPPSSDELDNFRDLLTKYVKQPVVRRYSGGGDINAACGTLAGAV